MPSSRRFLGILLVTLSLLALVAASTGDRNPNFQHCLRGCIATYCDPSQPPVPFYLRLFGWRCPDDCKYRCSHSFTDNIRTGSRWEQFYGKWPFYRLGPIQEPFSVLMSLGNLWVNAQGINETRRRLRPENRLRKWLIGAGWVQVNTWVWSTVFHTRDTPITERLDYFSATITIAVSMLYAILRTLHLQTPLHTSRWVVPSVAMVCFLVVSHFRYLLSFPLGSFPYGYHTKYVLGFAIVHHILWIIWSFSFKVRYPVIRLGNSAVAYPRAYHPRDPLKNRSPNAGQPFYLVVGTTLAMSFELLDFAPLWRIVDAHSVWHMCTIFLAAGWWTFFIADATEMESALIEGQPRDGLITTDPSHAMPVFGTASSVKRNAQSRSVESDFAQVARRTPPPKVASQQDR